MPDYGKAALSQLASIANYPHRKRISFSGTGSAETDYIMKLNVHRGNPVGDMVGTDIFLNGGCKTDFSDVRFTDANGNELEYYLQSHGNYELIYDDHKIGMHTIVYKGNIYADGLVDYAAGIYKSEDNGQTYSLLLASADLMFIDSSGYIYATDGYLLKRSIDDGVNWATVLDMTAVSGHIKYSCIAEDALGNLYAGRYQSTYDPTVYISADDGATWTASYTGATPSQHVHGVFVDPYTDYIYAGLDGNNGGGIKTIRSIDHGANWTDIWVSGDAGFVCMVCTATRRFFGGGTVLAGNAIYMTTDDITFTPVLPAELSIQGMRQLGNHIYAGGVEYGASMYPQIFQIDLDGTNAKTIWCGAKDDIGSFNGLCYMYGAATPNFDTERHLIVGSPSGEAAYLGGRIYDGGQHYEATFHIKIPLLPAAGTDINVICGNPSATSESDITIYSQPGIALPTPLIKILMNEGEGTTILDSSGNNRHGVLTHTAGKGSWNTYPCRRIGSAYPWMKHSGKSYNFAGDIVTIPTDATFEALSKNFTVIAWIKSISTSNPAQIIGKGNGQTWWSFQLRSPNNYIPGVTVGNGTSTNVKSSPLPGSAVNGQERMVGVIFNNDTPAKVAFIRDGKVSSFSTALTFDIVPNNNLPLTIGADAAGGNVFNGDIGEIHIYPGILTALQIQQLHENRMVTATEPAAVTTLT
jgi:hypothetical protein